MVREAVAEPWMGYAATGRPDFLNYLRRGDVTWSGLWEYYRHALADPGAMLRLIGLFHIFHSQDFDGQGCTFDEGSALGADLQAWSAFALDCADFLPEEKVRENLASLLGQSLISPLYYEAVFNVYLRALLEQLAQCEGVTDPACEAALPGGNPPPRRLRLLLDGGLTESVSASDWRLRRALAVERSHQAWERDFVVALGEDEEDWLDEGGEG